MARLIRPALDGGDPNRTQAPQPPQRPVLLWLLRALTAAGLAADAYVHADLASTYDPVRQNVSQGDLFRLDAAATSLAALVLMLSARRTAWAFALLVAVGSLGALLLYRYVDVGTLGPLPNMYEPIWFPEKNAAAIAGAAATVLAALGLVTRMYASSTITHVLRPAPGG